MHLLVSQPVCLLKDSDPVSLDISSVNIIPGCSFRPVQKSVVSEEAEGNFRVQAMCTALLQKDRYFKYAVKNRAPHDSKLTWEVA
jgi:hypothetical protein